MMKMSYDEMCPSEDASSRAQKLNRKVHTSQNADNVRLDIEPLYPSKDY